MTPREGEERVLFEQACLAWKRVASILWEVSEDEEPDCFNRAEIAWSKKDSAWRLINFRYFIFYLFILY